MNDHHRGCQRQEKERPSPNIMAQGHTGMTLQDAVRAAEDRERWRRIVKTPASHNATFLTEEIESRARDPHFHP